MCQVSCKMNQVWTSLCEKVQKTFKKPQWRNLARYFKRMTIVFDCHHLKTIIYIPNSIVCQVSCQTNQVWTILCKKVPKILKIPQTRKLSRNFKYMTTVFDFIHFNTIIYTKYNLVWKFFCKTKIVWTTFCEKVPKKH